MSEIQENRSAIWGGATLGLFVGIILGFFIKPYLRTMIFSILIGMVLGVVANLLSHFGKIINRKLTEVLDLKRYAFVDGVKPA